MNPEKASNQPKKRNRRRRSRGKRAKTENDFTPQICMLNNPDPNRPNNPNNSNNPSNLNIRNDPRKNFNSLYDGDADVIVVGQKDILRCENWTEMDFDQQLLKNIREEAGFDKPRKIQEVVLPYLSDGCYI
uniref:RNA helicase n=1 Tax=Panagrolaimus davidi TaxID=227884 RepID=A0A914QUH6_9BILA